MKNIRIAGFYHQYVGTCKITYMFAFARLLFIYLTWILPATVSGHCRQVRFQHLPSI